MGGTQFTIYGTDSIFIILLIQYEGLTKFINTIYGTNKFTIYGTNNIFITLLMEKLECQ